METETSTSGAVLGRPDIGLQRPHRQDRPSDPRTGLLEIFAEPVRCRPTRVERGALHAAWTGPTGSVTSCA